MNRILEDGVRSAPLGGCPARPDRRDPRRPRPRRRRRSDRRRARQRRSAAVAGEFRGIRACIPVCRLSCSGRVA
ncbi:hypothetical protein EHW12_34315 (plasmid) [Rhodococcus sp. NJ-530]|nr:hypothetical protein EHW12_34315 [Rhodococcus sp. NJ-530]